jgi:hypothetical protein
MAEDAPKKKKHTPGRDHDRKSARKKKERFARKAAKRRASKKEDARRVWREWDALPDDVKRLLGPAARPKVPRPPDEQETGS